MRNFHLPLPAPFYEEFVSEAKSQGRAATKLAREILESWYQQRKEEKLAEEILCFAQENGGTEIDHDPLLEEAGLQTLSPTV